MLADAHEPLLDEDYDLLRDVLDQIRPLALTLEYYRDQAALLEQSLDFARCCANNSNW